MKKTSALFLLFLFAVSAAWGGDGLFFHVEDRGFFDNREVHSPFQHSGTYFGTSINGELGYSDRHNSLSVGYYLIDNFGEQGLTDHGWTLYYAYSDKHFSGAFGSFPRRLLQRELPDVFVDEALRYYTPNLNGALLQYRSRRGSAELYCDWLSRQSATAREIFEIVSDGKWTLAKVGPSRFGVLYNARLTHFSVRSGKTTDKVYDKLMLNPSLCYSYSGEFVDRVSVTAGWMASLNRDRNDKIWKMPCGFLGEVRVGKGRFEVRDRLYAGQSLMSDYDLYGALLHRGDPYYRSPFYDRADVSFWLLRNHNVDCHVTASFHFTEGVMDNSQQIQLRVFF